MSLRNEAAKLAKEWQSSDQLLRDEILRVVKVVHTELSGIMGLIPQSLLNQAAKTIFAALPAVMLGKSIEDVILEAASGIPELSPYVRQLMSDRG